MPYNTKKCRFISKNNYSINDKNRTDYFFIPIPRLKEKIYYNWKNIRKANKLLLGPNFVPYFWNNFPDKKHWEERRFKQILKTVKGIIVHSNRVRNYLARKSFTMKMINKFKIVGPCINLKPYIIKSFNNRTNDIIFFEKYADLDHSMQGANLLELFKNSSLKIETLKYGNYSKINMINLASNSKFIIYFSFFNTGTIGLKEIQNYGVIAFSHQKDLVIDNYTSYYIPELADDYDMKTAFKIIIEKIKKIIQISPDSKYIAKKIKRLINVKMHLMTYVKVY